ncbi:hypothetical protein [Streptomyces sp. CFMR 7]|uniref:hypothetical protein n=1 Tax=Streptomyces sp. CFMR 7 TaxID=1649184 RepID=UPI0011A1A0E3|nr:hypothetical protein [Streptomyces sp. CFMR 7]
MSDFITLDDDSDLAHLIDLIDMLAGPEVTSLWGEGEHSVGSKFAYRIKTILSGQGRVQDVDYLAVYVLKYLGKGNTYISEDLITKSLRGVGGLPAAGHAWVEDATRTAWILATRYSLPQWRGYRGTPGQNWLSAP